MNNPPSHGQASNSVNTIDVEVGEYRRPPPPEGETTVLRAQNWQRPIAIAVAVAAAALAGCGLVPASTSEQSFCDGISDIVGGCDPDRPTFSGQTCDEIAREFGRQVDERVLAIANGPDDPEESKAVRVTHVKTLSASLVNRYLREQGLVSECGADEFLVTAEEEFSEELRLVAGNYLHDGPPATYEQWRDELRAFLQIIDQDEGLQS